jgi:hypothetical protein
MRSLRLAVILFSLPLLAVAAPGRDAGVFLLPLECSELLPDSGPYLQFFEAVGRGRLRNDKPLSKRIFEVLALREKMQKDASQSREQNPIDLLVRKTLCFYREKKEPLKMVPYDDPAFLGYLRSSLGDLEAKVREVISQREYDRQQRKEYERLLTENQELEDSVRTQAEVSADREFERLSNSARRKAKAP